MSHYFLAYPIPDDIKAWLAHRADGVKAYLPYRYWTDRDDYHITLIFLGAASTDQLACLIESVHARVKAFEPLSMGVGKWGVFGRPEMPRVIWRGVTAGRGLFDQQSLVKACAAACGFAVDHRPYRPHITIAKKWAGTAPVVWEELNKRLPADGARSWTAREIVLYEVHPERTPRYRAVEIFKFGRANGGDRKNGAVD